MTVLVTVTFDDDETVRISNEEVADTNYWEPWLLAIDNISFSLEYPYGGNRIAEWGSLKISNKLFTNEDYIWPPPLFISLKVEYTSSTEASAVTLVENATGQFSNMDEFGVQYDVYLNETDGVLLLEKTSNLDGACTADFNGNDVVLPRAVGTVDYAPVIRLENYSGNAVFHTGYMNGTINVDWFVWDDGVDITASCTVGGSGTSGTGTFYRSAAAVGEVTVSGNGTFAAASTMTQAIDALMTARLGAATIVGTNARSGDAKVGHWATSQELLISYVSRLCASHAHIISITDTSSFTAYLIKLEEFYTPTSEAYQDTKILPVGHEINQGPVSVVRTTWPEREQVDEGGRLFVKETTKETERSNSKYWWGTTTSTLTDKLKSDLSNTAWFNRWPGYISAGVVGFIGSDMLRPGMYVKNVTDNTSTTVVAFDSYVQLSINDDIFTSGEDFEVGYEFKHGRELSVKSFSTDVSTIEDNLTFIMNFMHARQSDLVIPLEDVESSSLAVFGREGRYVAEERRYARPLYLNYNKIIGIVYDFENEKVTYRIAGMVFEENLLT